MFGRVTITLGTGPHSSLNVYFMQYTEVVDIAFSALTLLVGHQRENPALKNLVVRCWHGYLSGARCE